MVALQLAVAERRLSPDKVIVHVVRMLNDGTSVVDPVTFDSLGVPQGSWPHDMFRRVIDDARKLAAIRRQDRVK